MSSNRLVYFPSAVFKMILSKNREPNQAHFMVPLHFNKVDIKEYLDKIYDVKCTQVNTMIMHVKLNNSKEKRRYKKAIITMKEEVDLPEFEKDFRKLDTSAYKMRSYFQNYNHPERMFMPHKGKTKFMMKQIEKIEKVPLVNLIQKTPTSK